MNKEKIIKVMINFEEGYLFELLGNLKDSLIEWTDSQNTLTKSRLVDIILAVNGLSLFKDEKFRYQFIVSAEDKKLLKHLADLCNIKYDSDIQSQILLAKKISKIPFEDRQPYTYLIKDYLGDTEFQFQKSEKENPVENIERSGCKFYELYDYQYMIKQQVINDLSNRDKDLYKILVHMPTGTGKTKTTMHIISHYLNFVTKNKGVVIWIAHSDELLMQAYETFKNVWSHLALFDIRIYKGWVNFPEHLNNGILFTSIQALQKKFGKAIFKELSEKASLVVFDEVHKAGAKITKKCIDELMKKNNEFGKKFIGLTATPGRTTEISKDNLLFSEGFDNIIGINVDKINMISLSANEARNYKGSKDPIRYFQDNGYLSFMEKKTLTYEVDPKILTELRNELKNDKENFSDDLIKNIIKQVTKFKNNRRTTKIIRRKHPNNSICLFPSTC